eukprot:COSAG05_NODE_26310_length_189_cov_34.066667_1_plen_40_part_01
MPTSANPLALVPDLLTYSLLLLVVVVVGAVSSSISLKRAT